MKIIETNLMDGVIKLSERFMEDPFYVRLKPKNIQDVALKIKKEIKDKSEHWLGYPNWMAKNKLTNDQVLDDSLRDELLLWYELIAGAVNYQYWCGKYNIRPNNSGATLMYQLLNLSFAQTEAIYPYRTYALLASNKFIENLAIHRFPALGDRIKHIREIFTNDFHTSPFTSYVNKRKKEDFKLEDFIEKVVISFPGYAQDIFLKRVFLLCMMLYRRTKWFEDEIHKLPIPADYQVPKVLYHLDCLSYDEILENKINANELIPYGSQIEHEIRAASILACKQLAEHAGCSMCDIDSYLWLKGQEIKLQRFHLTVTTDY